MSEVRRERWNTRLGFILAAVGSAVGLGNIWRFPYLTAEYGGAAFVVVYIFMLFLIGMPVMVAEFILGRSAKKSPVQALSQPGENNWSGLGYLFVLTGLGILSYYSVIAGWALRYSLESLRGYLLNVSPGDYFAEIHSGFDALLYHFVFIAITTGIVLGGVKKGIERAVKILIPLLVALIIGLGIWAFFQAGAYEGYSFYLQPDLEAMFETYTLNLFGMSVSFPFLALGLLGAAGGQTFFTLSLGMGAMITYASYLPGNDDLMKKTIIVSFYDVGIALLSGLMIFPIIFSFGLESEIAESPLGTLFMAIPEAFSQVENPYWGGFLSFVFFFCLLLAALTSAVSLLEVVTSSLMDELNMKRQPAAAAGGFACLLAGVPAALSLGWLDVADQIAGSFLLLLGGFFLAIYVGWLMKGTLDELTHGLEWNLVVAPWHFLIRYIVPVALLALLTNFVWDFSLQLWEWLGGL